MSRSLIIILIALCRHLGLPPLDFDGRSDSLLHPYDSAGRLYMQYLTDRGTYADVPYETILAAFESGKMRSQVSSLSPS